MLFKITRKKSKHDKVRKLRRKYLKRKMLRALALVIIFATTKDPLVLTDREDFGLHAQNAMIDTFSTETIIIK